jgi:alcohol dehydrogenase
LAGGAGNTLFALRKFVAPEFLFGVGARRRVGFYARNLQAKRAFVVSDPGVAAAGWLAEAVAALEAEGIIATVFTGVTPNPKDTEIMRAAYRESGSDVLVAVGGGSVIDCAKGVGIVVANGGAITDYEGVDAIPLPGPPLICVPTTAGTSADISQFAIVSATQRRTKIAIVSKTVVPDVALVDPETTLTMDPYLTACTGLDALTHAIEAYVSTASSPVVDVHALAAVKGVAENLLPTLTDGTDLAARERMMLASLQAGLAFSNASLGAVHALAHSLGGRFDLPHGESNALLLEHVVAYNYDSAVERFAHIAQTLGIPIGGMTRAQIRRALMERLTGLRAAAGVAGGLAERGVTPGAIADLAENAVNDACIYTNPRRTTVADAKVIYGEAL